MIRGVALGLFAGGAAALALTLARPAAAPFAPPVERPTFSRHTLAILPPPALEGPRLDRRIAKLQFQQAPLGQVLDEWRRQAGATLIVDWQDLSENGVSQETPVTVDLADVPASDALRIALASAYSARQAVRRVWRQSPMIDYGLRNGVVMVSGGERGFLSPSSHGYLRIYDIRDLMLESARVTAEVLRTGPDAPRPTPEAAELTQNSLQRDEPPTAEAYAFEQLAEAIKRSIDPPSWMTTEGEGGDMHYWAGRVIVVQTLENHGQVEKFLDELRAKVRATTPGSTDRRTR